MDKKKPKELTIKEFKKILNLIKSMLNDDTMGLEFAPFSVGVRIDNAGLNKELVSSDVNIELFNTGFSEINNILNMILRDRDKKFLEGIHKRERNELEEKCKLIEYEIITKKLIEKFIFQTTCKNYLLSDFDWEIVGHFGKGKDEFIPAVMIQLKLRNPSNDTPTGKDIRNIKFECDKDSIEQLIKELENIKENLEK